MEQRVSLITLGVRDLAVDSLAAFRSLDASPLRHGPVYAIREN